MNQEKFLILDILKNIYRNYIFLTDYNNKYLIYNNLLRQILFEKNYVLFGIQYKNFKELLEKDKIKLDKIEIEKILQLGRLMLLDNIEDNYHLYNECRILLSETIDIIYLRSNIKSEIFNNDKKFKLKEEHIMYRKIESGI